MTVIVTTLRERLRLDTRAAHRAADRAWARFDLTRASSLAAFLHAQREAAATLRRATPPDDPLAAMLGHACDAIDADLASLGYAGSPDRLKPPVPDHPLSRGYVWLATRLGTRMLSRPWRESAEPKAATAGRFIGGSFRHAAMRAQADALDARSGRGVEADAAALAANAWFALVEHRATLARQRMAGAP